LKGQFTDTKATLEERQAELQRQVDELLLLFEDDSRTESTSTSLPPQLRPISFKRSDGTYEPRFELALMRAVFELGYKKAVSMVKDIYRLSGHEITDNPARSYLQRIMRRLAILCEMQVALAVIEHIGKLITALHDATGHKGRHVQAFKLQVGEIMYSLGVSEVADGCATTSFVAFVRRLQQLITSLDKAGQEDQLLRDALQKISSSLSDTCATEGKWAKLLEEKRFETIQHDYSQMAPEEQKAKAKVFLFIVIQHARLHKISRALGMTLACIRCSSCTAVRTPCPASPRWSSSCLGMSGKTRRPNLAPCITMWRSTRSES
jgi:hypothetical protein